MQRGLPACSLNGNKLGKGEKAFVRAGRNHGLPNSVTIYALFNDNAMPAISQFLDLDEEKNAAIHGVLQLPKIEDACSDNMVNDDKVATLKASIEASAFPKISILLGPYEEIDADTVSYLNTDISLYPKLLHAVAMLANEGEIRLEDFTAYSKAMNEFNKTDSNENWRVLKKAV